jgi:hypothetical protein
MCPQVVVLNKQMYVDKIPSDTTCYIILRIKYLDYIVSASTRPSSGHYKNAIKVKITRFGGACHT